LHLFVACFPSGQELAVVEAGEEKKEVGDVDARKGCTWSGYRFFFFYWLAVREGGGGLRIWVW
jgi:hypothetical protein